MAEGERLPLFGEYVLDTGRGSLLRAGRPVHLRPQAYRALKFLTENRGRLMSKDSLIEEIWEGRAVTDDSLVQCLRDVRRALGDSGEQYLRNERGRGYIFDPNAAEAEQSGGTMWTEQVDLLRVVVEDEAEVARAEAAIDLMARGARGATSHMAQAESGAEYAVNRVRRRRRFVLLVSAALVLMIAAVAFAYFKYSGRPSQAITSIAVLPFVNEGADQDKEYLSDGLSESLINGLSQVPRLKVIARSSAFRYKGRDVNPQDVARELGVQAILMGRVAQRGDILVVSVELVDAREGTQVWGEQYSRRAADLQAIQQEISREISEQLRLRLTGEERKLVSKRYTEDAEAYQLYLLGRYHWNRRTREDLEKSIGYFGQATTRDPNFALAYAGLADVYAVLPAYAPVPFRETQPKAEAAALKALELDDTLAEAHIALAVVKKDYYWDFAGAEREFKRGIGLNPNYATAHMWYSDFLSSMGRHDEAIAEMERVRELDPFSLVINSTLGRAFYFARRHDQAIEQLRKTLELDKNFALAQGFLGAAYLGKGMYEEAMLELKKAVALSSRNGEPLSYLGYAYAVRGQRGEALKILAELKGPSWRNVSTYNIAIIYAGLGERDRAFEQLEQAYRKRDAWLTYLKVEPAVDTLRSDPRFRDLLTRIGLTP